MRPARIPHLLSGLLGPLLSFGQTYFQQEVDYVIDARLDDRTHVLHATESFTYQNNSPTTLDTLWIHLWPNAYKDRTSALCEQLDRNGELDLHFASEDERGWIDSLDFKADDQQVQWGHHPEHADIGWIKLKDPLGPGGRTTISTPFRVKIPDGKFSRLGHTGQAYYITQWYPKPAVFDAQGWHAMPYLTQGEFYSEFGSFDVSITLPANYVVGATGIQQDARERAWMDSLADNTLARRQEMPDLRTGEPSNAFPPSSTTSKTIRFVQDNVHDFAWFADKRFIVQKAPFTIYPSERTITAWTLFTPKNAELWKEATSYVGRSVHFYSEHVGEYPYDECTAVDGTISAGAGMEYPMITIIGDMGGAEGLDNVIAHEVGHNWFYGILGSNEREHAWMDEGMNSFVELCYLREHYPRHGFNAFIQGLEKTLGDSSESHRAQSEMLYRLNARRNLDQPVSLTSSHYTGTNYGSCVYAKTALVFDHLLAYIGEETMKKCMRAYFAEWKFKHPRREDVQKVFERVSGKDLSWVFDEMIGTRSVFDPKAWKLEKSLDGRSVKLTVHGKSIFDTPMPVTAFAGADSLGTKWIQHGKAGKESTHDLEWPNADRIRIDAANRTLDLDRRNNAVRSHGLFRRWTKPELKFLLGLEKNGRRSVYWTPVPAWNGNDGWQLGVALYNTTFPSQPTEWVVAPLYGFASERWGGAGRIEHHFDRMRSPLFQNITLGLSARSASEFRDNTDLMWFGKLSPYLHLDLRREPLSRPWEHRISARGVHLQNEARSTGTDGSTLRGSDSRFYTEVQYRAENKSKLHRSLVLPTVTREARFLRASLELRQAFALNDRNDEIRFRAFMGTFLWKRNDRLYNGLHAWGLTWGTQDMLYDHAYLERNARDAFTARQYHTQQGAFKTPFLQGGSETWIGALNMEMDVPISLPLALFGSVGMVPITRITPDGRSTATATYYEAGVGIIAVRDVLEVWIPLVVSDRIADEEKFLDRTITDRIRFIFALEKLDPTRILRNLKP